MIAITTETRCDKIIEQIIFPMLSLYAQNKVDNKRDETCHLLAWLINIYQTDNIMLDRIRNMFNKLILYYQNSNQYAVFE